MGIKKHVVSEKREYIQLHTSLYWLKLNESGKLKFLRGEQHANATLSSTLGNAGADKKQNSSSNINKAALAMEFWGTSHHQNSSERFFKVIQIK